MTWYFSTETNKGSSESSGSLSSKCGPLTPDQALRLYRTQLTPLEQSEVLSYPDIYFVGPNAKKRPAVAGGSNNCGYDDEQGGYIHVPHDHLGYRYEFLKVRPTLHKVVLSGVCQMSNVSRFIFLQKHKPHFLVLLIDYW